MPLCVLLGTVLLFAFVNYSHDYLSDYFIRNSKPLIGQKVDIGQLAEHLGATQMTEWVQTKPNADTRIVFWSLTCSPCLEKLSKLTPTSTDQIVIPVNVDPYSDIQESEKVLKSLAPQFAFYHDKERFMMNTFKVDYLPTYVVLDSKGFIKQVLAGPLAN